MRSEEDTYGNSTANVQAFAPNSRFIASLRSEGEFQ